ncbi:MAG: Asp-tRNA(Asn)/Glu-tRNA(Gln) amidotransferase subunit GatB [Candidatus Neomarinimicrobiota bacterium]
MTQKYEVIIGLEIHAQLLTDTKIFCRCKNKYGAEANSLVCPVCLGLPGTLPILNQKCVEFAVKMGLATGCSIARFSRFARKNYFYPDLTKGYQISQYDEPLCANGSVLIHLNGVEKRIGITRIHLEEDAGKSIHNAGEITDTLVDYNRCGVPLIEIVSEPDMRSPEEAYAYLTKLKQLLEYLEICDCNMEEGSLRCDANISLRPFGQEKFGTKTEMKNMNSFRGVERALNFEIQRQMKILDEGGQVLQQTLLWNETTDVAKPMRTKEESDDYRYFPEPDLVPLRIDDAMIDQIQNTLPELPDDKFNRFIRQYQLREYDAKVLTSNKDLSKNFELTVEASGSTFLSSKIIQTEVLHTVKEKIYTIRDFPIHPDRLGKLVKMINENEITHTVGKEVFNKMLTSLDSPEQIVAKENLAQINDSEGLEAIIKEMIIENPDELEKYRAGKKALFGFFMGQVMKKTKGKANPDTLSSLLKKALE